MLITHWFSGELIQRLLKNAGILLAGNSIAYFLGFVSYLLTARSLGPQQFGVLITIQAYVLVIDRLVNFQSWQAIIKFGAEDLESGNINSLKSLIKFGFLLDFSTAILGTAIALAGYMFLTHVQHWDVQIAPIGRAYCFLILANLSGTPTAILRLFNKFKVYIIPQVVTQSLRFICIIAAYCSHSPFVTYFYIWLFWDIA